MFVSIRRVKEASIAIALLGSSSCYLMYYTHRTANALDEKYYRLLQEQTAGLANMQIERKRIDLIKENKPLLVGLEPIKNTDQQRRLVLSRIEHIAKNNGLVDVNYEFLPVQHFMDVHSKMKVVSDSLRLKGEVPNMVVFNQAISRLADGPIKYFELKACDIKRKKTAQPRLYFDCQLGWYLLV